MFTIYSRTTFNTLEREFQHFAEELDRWAKDGILDLVSTPGDIIFQVWYLFGMGNDASQRAILPLPIQILPPKQLNKMMPMITKYILFDRIASLAGPASSSAPLMSPRNDLLEELEDKPGFKKVKRFATASSAPSLTVHDDQIFGDYGLGDWISCMNRLTTESGLTKDTRIELRDKLQAQHSTISKEVALHNARVWFYDSARGDRFHAWSSNLNMAVTYINHLAHVNRPCRLCATIRTDDCIFTPGFGYLGNSQRLREIRGERARLQERSEATTSPDACSLLIPPHSVHESHSRETPGRASADGTVNDYVRCDVFRLTCACASCVEPSVIPVSPRSSPTSRITCGASCSGWHLVTAGRKRCSVSHIAGTLIGARSSNLLNAKTQTFAGGSKTQSVYAVAAKKNRINTTLISTPMWGGPPTPKICRPRLTITIPRKEL